MNLHKKSILRYTAILAALAAISSSFAGTELILGTPFGDHMVLQREKPIPVWGWAPPAAEIIVSFAGQTHTSKSDAEGAWKVTLPALPAGGPHEMLVAGPSEVRITDILVGEVWVCSGQSNMAMAMSETDKAAEDIAAADFPKMRLLKLPAHRSGLPERVPPKPRPGWIACSPATAKSFNAAAYFFGREIHRETGVPIGLIAAASGSTQIEPWTPQEGLALVPSLEKWHTAALEVDAKYRKALVEFSNTPTEPPVPAPVTRI
jgi:sialate O-acetylesterase